MKDLHKMHMRWALALAQEGMGRTSPNPMVGAVVVKNGRVAGEGYHRVMGGPHAEANAIKSAGAKAKGADLYVTLEPCCHHGKTPPCTDAIIAAGIARVIIGTRDPNPLVKGKGVRALKRAGIEVIEGVLEGNCRELNFAFNKHVQTGIPHVTLKAALTLDGKMATASGDSKWITGKECRKYCHSLRAASDAVMVGVGSVKKDDPLLTVRFGQGNSRMPKAVVVDSRLSIPLDSKLLARKRGEVIVACAEGASKKKMRAIEGTGHHVIACKGNKNGNVDIPHLLKELGARGITSVLVEGGAKLFAEFFRQKLIDRAVICIAPKFIGWAGKDMLPGIAIGKISGALKLKDVLVKQFGEDVVIEGNL